MQNKFTPGEWWYSNISDELISMPLQVKIAKRISGNTESETNANRALIEKAPDLYNCLLDLLSEMMNKNDILKYSVPYKNAIDLIEKIDKNSQL